MLPENQIHRDKIFEDYVKLGSDYIFRMVGGNYDEIVEFVKNEVRHRYTGKKIQYILSPSPGNIKLVEGDLWKFFKELETKVISPSGSIYYPAVEKMSFISNMVVDKLAERKKVKKIMLKAKAAGDDQLARRCHYQQATIKINCNSLPGGFASPYNIFYDKGGYNSITSSARCMIARAYTVAEQLIGGNFSWFSVEELINHIILNLRIRVSDDEIVNCCKKFKLKIPTKKELLDFYTESIRTYVPNADMSNVDKLISTLSEVETTYLFYYCNLRHIMWYNEDVFKGYIKYVMDTKDLKEDPNSTVDDVWKVDDTIMAVTTVAFSEELGNYNLKQITEEHKEYVKTVVGLAKMVEHKLHSLDELFRVFVYTDADIPEIKKKPFTRRNTVIISDTDSVIFNAESWDKWFRGQRFDITKESYQITSLVIYWLHHAVRHCLYRFSVLYGVSPDYRRVLAMKNEFLYPVMLLYNIKKTYAGLCTVQEGVRLPKPNPDIKGQTLRGSQICQTALTFISDFIIKDILTPSMNGKLSAVKLIKKVVGFEEQIKKSISEGSTEFLKITSLGKKSDYKNPESAAAYFAYMFWQECFAAKYGDIQPPLKTVFIPVLSPTMAYYEMLAKKNPKLYKNIQKFVEQHKKFPNNMIINPLLDKIPEEIIPLIDVRSIIYHNIRPTYTTLERLNIGVGLSKMKMLLSDVYGSDELALSEEQSSE